MTTKYVCFGIPLEFQSKMKNYIFRHTMYQDCRRFPTNNVLLLGLPNAPRYILYSIIGRNRESGSYYDSSYTKYGVNQTRILKNIRRYVRVHLLEQCLSLRAIALHYFTSLPFTQQFPTLDLSDNTH
jgi:hypothetical protein